MVSIYSTTGLDPEQIDSIDDLTSSYMDDERKLSLEVGSDALARMDQFSSHIRADLENLGLDLNDPRIHFAVVAGASIMANYVCEAQSATTLTNATVSIVMGAVVSTRPLRDIQ